MIEKIRQFIQSVIVWLTRVVTQPRSELDRWQRAALFTYDLSRFGARQLRHDRAPQMAAALAFRVLFGMLPVLIVATILVRSAIGTTDFMTYVGNILDAIGANDIQIAAPDLAAHLSSDAPIDPQPGDAAEIAPPIAAPDAGQPPADQSMSLKTWIQAMIDKAAEINLGAIGAVGFTVIVYAAISLMVTIENSFNTIFRAPEGRSWVRRVPLYWFILTISPAVIGLAAYLDGWIDNLIGPFDKWYWLSEIGGFLWVVLIEWLFMFAVYTLVPNTEVAPRPAAVGAAIAVLLLEVGKRTMGAYLKNAFTIGHLYGSLGLVPVFMFWVYLMWLGVLFGLQVAATLQMLHGRRLDEIEQKREAAGLIDPATVLTVMEIVTARFNRGKQTTARKIAEEASLPQYVVAQILSRLAEAGMVHQLDREEQTVALAKPPEQIHADELIDIGFALADCVGDGRHGSLFERLRESQRKLAASVTLASLVPSAPSSTKSNSE